MPNQSTSLRRRFYQLGSPIYFYQFATRWAHWAGGSALLLFLISGYGGLVLAPVDYQMGDSYRILFVHAPAAWMSMFAYAVMAVAAGIGLIWHMKLGDAVARACAPIGATFTLCALITGSLWGKPTWGTYWVWDARLTSELVLLFLFFGYIALSNAIEDRQTASRAAAILALVGLLNLPIIHYSVEWWNTLHQGASVTKFGKPTIDIRMLIPLLLMFGSFKLYFSSVVLHRVRCELLISERRAKWVEELLDD